MQSESLSLSLKLYAVIVKEPKIFAIIKSLRYHTQMLHESLSSPRHSNYFTSNSYIGVENKESLKKPLLSLVLIRSSI